MRLVDNTEIMDFCIECGELRLFKAPAAEYADISFLGNIFNRGKVPDDAKGMEGMVEDKEMKKYLYSFQAGKSAGLDEFHVEFLHAAPPSFVAMLRHHSSNGLAKAFRISTHHITYD